MHVPNWPELSMQRRWEQCQQIPHIRDYFPENWYPDGSRVDRKYFWAIVSYLDDGFVMHLMEEIRRGREAQRKQQEIQVAPDVPITAEWLERLQSGIFHPSKYLVLASRFELLVSDR